MLIRATLILVAVVALRLTVWAGTTGSISGTVTDQTGSVVPGARVTVISTSQGLEHKSRSDAKGAYAFPSLPVGEYRLEVQAQGFKPQSRTGLRIDLDSALQMDLTLELAEKVEKVTVTENPLRIETASTQVGEVVSVKSMTAV